MKDKRQKKGDYSLELFRKKCSFLSTMYLLLGLISVLMGVAVNMVHLTIVGVGIVLMGFIIDSTKWIVNIILSSLNSEK